MKDKMARSMKMKVKDPCNHLTWERITTFPPYIFNNKECSHSIVHSSLSRYTRFLSKGKAKLCVLHKAIARKGTQLSPPLTPKPWYSRQTSIGLGKVRGKVAGHRFQFPPKLRLPLSSPSFPLVWRFGPQIRLLSHPRPLRKHSHWIQIQT